MTSHHRYFIIHKPRNMVSQFVSSHEVGLLGDIAFDFPEGTHAIGRLDKESEGLLILTTNRRVTELLFKSKIPHERNYLVLVKYAVSSETLEKLCNGISIQVKGGGDYQTLPCKVSVVANPEVYITTANELPQFHEHTWLLMSLTEGKFHQVRKMVAAAGHKCVRLIRVSIEDLTLNGLQRGEVMEVEEESFFEKLKIDDWK